jgi:hypothetical protein
VQSAVGILAEEFSRSVPGQQTVLDRLLDLLLVLSLVIGGEELLETSVVIAALDDAERRRVWA